ncbi:C2H2-type zinc finger protein [Halomicrococcus sp. SG-WS-1]
MADEHECQVCGETFNSEDELNEHAQEEHENEM